jgi:hypothetical protein
MKTNRNNRLARMTGFSLAAALLVGTAGALSANEIPTAKGGATRLLELSGTLVTAKPRTSGVVKPMSCAKCRDQYVSRADGTARGANKPAVTVAKHLCAGCENTWVVSGHGKAKASTAVHTCTSCGAESLACCSTTKSGITATKGMEKKFEVAPVE